MHVHVHLLRRDACPRRREWIVIRELEFQSRLWHEQDVLQSKLHLHAFLINRLDEPAALLFYNVFFDHPFEAEMAADRRPGSWITKPGDSMRRGGRRRG